jgi:pimeloyl-ACP methyl ester carboxylesterase
MTTGVRYDIGVIIMTENRKRAEPPAGPTEGTVTSRDGTTIAFDRQGDGPPVILVAAALSDRSDTTRLAALLAEHFTVINYDRRGRGDSGNTAPYRVEREIEDLEAVIEAAGGSAYVFGSSSGAVLALRAASSGANITKLALFEPPFPVPDDDSGATPPTDSAARARALVEAGRRDDAVKHFMTHDVGVPGPFLLVMRVMMRKMWSNMVATAHTLPYDYAIVEDSVDGKPLADLEWVSVTAPTLVLDGGKSPARLRRPAHLVATVVPGAQHRTLDGQNHGAVMTAPKVIASALVEFFGS